MTETCDVLVLGGGPAGLACAWWAARDGRSVTLLERADHVGGLAASFDIGGVRVDHGSHRLHPATAPAILSELTEILGNDLQRRPRHGRVQVLDRWVSFPPSPVELARELPPRLAARLARDALVAPFRRPRRDTFDEVVRATVGPALGEVLYFPMAHKLWGAAPEALSGEQARRRIGATSLVEVARRVLRRTQPHFFYPKHGFGQIAEALAQSATDAGASLHTAVAVDAVDVREPARARVRAADGSQFEGRVLFSTIPLAALVPMVEPEAPSEITGAASRARTRGMVLVYLVLASRQWTEFDAHYLPSRSVLPTRISEPRNYRDADDPADRTVLCAEIPCWPEDEVWRMSDGDLAGRVVDDIARAGLPPVQPVDSHVRRVRSVYPVYGAGFEDDLEVVEQWLARFPALVTLGRQGLFAHDNTHHTLEMAAAAVEALQADGTVDRADWAASRAAFRTHVVED